MKDGFLKYKGNLSSIRLQMIISFVISISLLIIAVIGYMLSKSEVIGLELIKTASWILGIGVGGKTLQGIAENYKESRLITVNKEYRRDEDE